MFITSNGSASFRHPSVAPHKQKHWPVVTRALEGPWYLVVYDVTCRKGRRVSQTSLVACDEALVNMLAEIAIADVKGIGRLDRRHGPAPCWALRWIDALWAPAPGETRRVGPLLLRFDAEFLVRDALLRPVGELPGRRLLYLGCDLLGSTSRCCQLATRSCRQFQVQQRTNAGPRQADHAWTWPVCGHPSGQSCGCPTNGLQDCEVAAQFAKARRERGWLATG